MQTLKKILEDPNPNIDWGLMQTKALAVTLYDYQTMLNSGSLGMEMVLFVLYGYCSIVKCIVQEWGIEA